MIADLKPYTAMKDSGVEWVGEVPEHWALRRMKIVLRERTQKGFPDEPLLAATQTKGVVRKDKFENRTVLALKDLHLLKLVRAGDFVISLRSFQGGIEYAREQGIISPAYTILCVCIPENHGYLTRLFKSKPYIENLGLFVTGIRQGQNIDYQKLSRSPIPLPPLPDQAAIVRYLGHVDRRVRRLVRAKRKLLALLTEQKQAIIHRAVTSGLDPNVPLKDSGVEWLGEVPEHWVVLRTRFLFWEVDQRSTTGQELHLSMSQRLGLVPSDMVQSTLTSESFVGGKLCQEDDLVLNRLKAHLGVFSVSRQAGVISPDYSVFRKKRPMNMSYFERVLRSPACRRELRIRAKGIVEGFWRLYTEDFYDICLPVPPVVEQDAIVGELDQATAKIDTAVTRANRESELLNELHIRLIADVVTGKLDVREAAAALPDVNPREAEESSDDTLDADAEEDLDELDATPVEAEV